MSQKNVGNGSPENAQHLSQTLVPDHKGVNDVHQLKKMHSQLTIDKIAAAHAVEVKQADQTPITAKPALSNENARFQPDAGNESRHTKRNSKSRISIFSNAQQPGRVPDSEQNKDLLQNF